MTDDEYKIIEEHEDPEVKGALNKLHDSLSNLQEEIRKRDQRKTVTVLTDYILSDVYAIRARYAEDQTVTDEQFKIFRESVRLLEDFTNGLYKEEDQ